jgi:hypothetical protein
MSMRLAGFLLIVLGAGLLGLAGLAIVYFDFSLWLLLPGAAIVAVGLSLLDGAQEQVLGPVRHRIADATEESPDNCGLVDKASEGRVRRDAP